MTNVITRKTATQQASARKIKRQTGVVKWFNTEKGYGFVVNDDGEDVFVHYRSIQAEGFKNLRENDLVQYTQIKSDKGWQAAEVVLLEHGSQNRAQQRTHLESHHHEPQRSYVQQ